MNLKWYREEVKLMRRPVIRPMISNTLRGLMLILTFPFMFVAGGVYLIGLAARAAWEKPPVIRVNNTPCGGLCRHAHWSKAQESWRCDANQGWLCDVSRSVFTVERDPNNCTMFERKHY